jgi:hypothetical protein
MFSHVVPHQLQLANAKPHLTAQGEAAGDKRPDFLQIAGGKTPQAPFARTFGFNAARLNKKLLDPIERIAPHLGGAFGTHRTGSAAADLAHFVVGPAPLGAPQHLVGFGNRAKAFRRLGLSRMVGVPTQCKPAVIFSDVLERSRWVDF